MNRAKLVEATAAYLTACIEVQNIEWAMDRTANGAVLMRLGPQLTEWRERKRAALGALRRLHDGDEEREQVGPVGLGQQAPERDGSVDHGSSGLGDAA